MIARAFSTSSAPVCHIFQASPYDPPEVPCQFATIEVTFPSRDFSRSSKC